MEMNSKRRLILRRLVACVLFLILFLAVLTRVERLLIEDNGNWAMVAHEAIPKNSADVAFIGASLVFCDIIPQKLMDDYGLASINASYGGLAFCHNVYELEWLLQRQRLRVVVVDLFNLGRLSRGFNADSSALLAPRSIPWTNPLKYSVLAREITMDPYTLPYLTTIGILHNSIWELTRSAFMNARGQSVVGASFAHYSSTYAVYGKDFDASVAPDANAVLSELDRATLLRLNELCKANGAELVLMGLPHLLDSRWLGMVEEVRALAEEQGIAYLDMDVIMSGSGLHFAADMADQGHANYQGAQKITDFIGQYLKENYDLPDRREDSDPRYDVWKKRPDYFAAYTTGRYIIYVSDFDEWVCEAENLNEDYLLIFATNRAHNAVAAEDINWDIITFLGMLGLEEAETIAEEECGWFAIMDGTEIRVEETVHGDLNYAVLVGGHPLTLRASGGKDLRIKLDNVQINCGHEGLNIILYNKVTHEVIVAACLDLTQEGIALKHNDHADWVNNAIADTAVDWEE